MICISIAQSSRTMAKVDILNAAGQADLIEIRLDAFDEAPNIREMIEISSKPVIFSCRRQQDGGQWAKDEAARLALLRQAVLDKAAYVEIELDVAGQIRRYGDTRRIITYTTLQPVTNLDEVYAECCEADADVVKIVAPARRPEETWPMIKLIAKGRKPTVAVGLGRNAIMLSLLGQRYKAPWVYASLEQGMEAYPGVPTVADLLSIFRFRDIDVKTPLLAVSGSPADQRLMASLLNAGFEHARSAVRVLPLEMGDVLMFGKIARATKLEGVFVDEAHREDVAVLCDEAEERVELAGSADFISLHGDKWKAFNTLSRAITHGIEARMAERYPGEDPIAKRQFLVVGTSGVAKTIIAGLKKKGGVVVVADRDNARAQQVCTEMGARYMPAGQVYGAITDAIILCADDRDPAPGKPSMDVPKSCAREGVLCADLSNFPRTTALLAETKALGGLVVQPADMLVDMMAQIVKAYTGDAGARAAMLAIAEGEGLSELPSAD